MSRLYTHLNSLYLNGLHFQFILSLASFTGYDYSAASGQFIVSNDTAAIDTCPLFHNYLLLAALPTNSPATTRATPVNTIAAGTLHQLTP